MKNWYVKEKTIKYRWVKVKAASRKEARIIGIQRLYEDNEARDEGTEVIVTVESTNY